MDSFLKGLQKIGKGLMLPVATLPAAGILLAFGVVFQGEQMLSYMPFLAHPIWQLIFRVMEQTGGVIFSNLALLFAIAVAITLSENDGVSALAATVGFLMLNMAMGVFLNITPELVAQDPARYALVLGIPTLQTGVFGGIMAGIVAAWCFNKFYKIELPQFLGFFAGKRFVPIATAVFSILLAFIMIIIWPPIQNGITFLSVTVIESNRALAAFFYGSVQRALVPFGLHHIINATFWYQLGEYTSPITGELIVGDQFIFFYQVREGLELTAGTFMTGMFPFMMFGLPAAALAMYHEAKPSQKKIAGGILFSAALTSFLTGITEPIEFSFLFVAPILYVIHVFIAGLSFVIMEILNVRVGFTFSGGFIDFMLFGVLINRTAWWWIIIVGLFMACFYYVLFRFAIRKFNLKTPGREDEDKIVKNPKTVETDDNIIAFNIIKALGGKENLEFVEACITRLRINVKDPNIIDETSLKALGAMGVIKTGTGVQVIYGAKAQVYAIIINDYRSGKLTEPKSNEENSIKGDEDMFFKRNKDKKEDSKKEFKVVSPMSGKIIPITEVPDEVFSQKMMGDGFAIVPSEGLVVSPVDGKIINIFPTKHAIGILAGHVELIIHVGIDTVNLQGENFEALVKEGDTVNASDEILKFDLDFVNEKAPSSITPVIFTNLDNKTVKILKEGNVEKGEANIIEIN